MEQSLYLLSFQSLFFSINDPPNAVPDFVSTTEDISLTITPLDNDTDADLDSLVIIDISTPTHGKAKFSSKSIDYFPDSNFAGTDYIIYTVSDKFMSVTALITISVVGFDDPPVAVDDIV